MPYPNTDGEWFNYKYDREAQSMLQSINLQDARDSPAALPAEIELALQNETSARPVAQYYRVGLHGTCRAIRKSLLSEFNCLPSGLVAKDKLSKVRGHSYAHGYRQATFCPCPGGDSPSAKRMFDALFSGCIPVILSEDFVWPFTNEFDQDLPLDPSLFSIRVDSDDYSKSQVVDERNCTWGNRSESFQGYLESITAKAIQELRLGVELVGRLYAYYEKSDSLPNNPLRMGILPTGGAAHALVKALAERQNGQRWPACEKELEERIANPTGNAMPDPVSFKC